MLGSTASPHALASSWQAGVNSSFLLYIAREIFSSIFGSVISPRTSVISLFALFIFKAKLSKKRNIAFIGAAAFFIVIAQIVNFLFGMFDINFNVMLNFENLNKFSTVTSIENYNVNSNVITNFQASNNMLVSIIKTFLSNSCLHILSSAIGIFILDAIVLILIALTSKNFKYLFLLILPILNTIFNIMPAEIRNKIPQEYIKEIERHKLKNYSFKYDYNKSLDEQPINDIAREVLTNIYIEYMCDDEEREEYYRKLKILEQSVQNSEKSQNNNYKNLFKNNNYKEDNVTKILMEIKKEKWYKKILLFFKNSFKK